MTLDFAYPWWLSYGHLAVALSAGLLAAVCFRFRRRWLGALLAVVTLWGAAIFLLIRFGVRIDAQAPLPTENFLRDGRGRVLDLGAGTGRSAIMVLGARPQATLVALDLFGDSFGEHFGPDDNPQGKLLRNLRAAGVEGRATVVTADMRELPFDDSSFDAIVSSYAVDHLNREGTDRALREALRVTKPGGEFLLMVINADRWLRFAFGPLLAHGGLRGQNWWTSHVQEAGFEIQEQGTPPITQYILARRPASRR